MWLSDSPPAHLNRSCGSVLVLDTAPISGTSLLAANARYGAAASDGARERMLSFLLLAASKVAINVRRQPPLELLERLVGAALAAHAVRPMEDAADEAEAAAASAAEGGPSCAGDGGRAFPALPPPPSAHDCDEGEVVHVAAATAYGNGGTAPDPPAPPNAYDSRAALVMVLRDSLESVGSPTAAAEAAAAAAAAAEMATAAAAHAAAYAAEAARAARAAAVWSRWLPGSAGRALRAAVRSTDLLSVRPPTEANLRQLEVNGIPRPTQRVTSPSPPAAAPAQHGATRALDTAEAVEESEMAGLAEVTIESTPSAAPSPPPPPPPQQQQPASSFTGALARSALDLTSELRAVGAGSLAHDPSREGAGLGGTSAGGGGAMDGAALATWMEHVASRLNALEAGTKLQGV